MTNNLRHLRTTHSCEATPARSAIIREIRAIRGQKKKLRSNKPQAVQKSIGGEKLSNAAVKIENPSKIYFIGGIDTSN